MLRGAATGLFLPAGVQAWETPWNQWAQTDDESAAPAASSATLTVMTRNLYVGANLFRAFADNPDDIPAAVGSLLHDVRMSRFEDRAEAIVDEIATAQPDLVGLQEVALLRIQRPGDYEAEPGRTNASEVDIDFLEVLTAMLAERGLSYDVVSSVTNVDIELPAEVDAGRVDVRLTDRDVILAHESITTQNAQSERYLARIDLPFPDGVTYPLLRGYCTVDAEVDGVGFTFANTHLESVSASTQVEQARELLVALSDRDDPVILVGDFNSPADGDGTVTYDLLTRFFTDAYAEAGTDAGYTCCQVADLRAPEPRLGRRIDFVFYRGTGTTTAVERVGDEPSDRVGTYVRGEYQRLWPSDHAGIVATLELEGVPLAALPEPTAAQNTVTPDTTATADTTETASVETATAQPGDTPPPSDASDSTPSTDVSAPGLGVVSGLAGLAAVAAALARRRRQS